jgi:hypothetical protein
MNRDASFNSYVFVNPDSNGSRLVVNSDASFNGNIIFGNSAINNDGTLTMNRDASFNSYVFVNPDSNGSRLVVNSDADFNGTVNFQGVITQFNNVNDGIVVFNATTEFSNDVTFSKDAGEETKVNFEAKTEFFNNVTFSKGTTGDVTTTKIVFNANVEYNGAFTNGSDYRIKSNIVSLNNTNFSIDNLNPVFYFNENIKKNDIGFIAHELQEYFPFLVNGEKDGEKMQSVNYIGLIGMLVHEIQTLKKKVENIENSMNTV